MLASWCAIVRILLKKSRVNMDLTLSKLRNLMILKPPIIAMQKWKDKLSDGSPKPFDQRQKRKQTSQEL